MKRKPQTTRMALAPSLAVLLLAAPVDGANLTSARVTQVVREVKVVAGGDARAASIGDSIRGSEAVTTGRLSRAELEFNDKTLLRLGANTTFSLATGRTLELKEGSVLLQTTPGGNGVNIRAGSVTAAITGSLAFFSVSEPTDPERKGKELVVKLISIHGGIGLNANGKTYDLDPFEILVARVDLEGNLIGEPEIRTLDGARLLGSSKLVNGFPGNDRIDRGEILAVLNRQGGEKNRNEWVAVPNPLDPSGPPGTPRTIGLNSLIRGLLPGKQMPPTTSVRKSAPPKGNPGRIFTPGKNKNKGKVKNRPKRRPKPRPNRNPSTSPQSPQDSIGGSAPYP